MVDVFPPPTPDLQFCIVVVAVSLNRACAHAADVPNGKKWQICRHSAIGLLKVWIKTANLDFFWSIVQPCCVITSTPNRQRSRVSWLIRCKAAPWKATRTKKDAHAFLLLGTLFLPPKYSANTALVPLLKCSVTVDTSAWDRETGRAPLRVIFYPLGIRSEISGGHRDGWGSSSLQKMFLFLVPLWFPSLHGGSTVSSHHCHKRRHCVALQLIIYITDVPPAKASSTRLHRGSHIVAFSSRATGALIWKHHN